MILTMQDNRPLSSAKELPAPTRYWELIDTANIYLLIVKYIQKHKAYNDKSNVNSCACKPYLDQTGISNVIVCFALSAILLDFVI